MPGLTVEELRFLDWGPLAFELLPGELVGLSGASGAGKTLLLRALADLDPHEGRIELDGVPAQAFPAPAWRARVGLLPSEPAWWYDGVAEHFERLDARLLEELGELGFDPDVLDWSVQRLSAGERQRLGLARLLHGRPQVLLLDEPTANLDEDNALRVEAVVRDYADRRAAPVLWVAHDEEQLERVCKRRLRLEEKHLHEVDGR